MRHRLRTALLATAVALATVGSVMAPDPVQAQPYQGASRHSFRSFHRTLARYGDWVYSDRWGEVWIPNVPGSFRPYRTGGYWANTSQYGWFWRSSYPWGDIAFHYGRWVNDPDDGWLWIPGYVWSPGWVVWRGNNRYVGWMPMPPDRDFLRGNEASLGFSISGRGFSLRFGSDNSFYGYESWYGRDYDRDRFASNWTFVGTGHLADRDYRPNVVNQTNVVNIIQNTTNITNYTVVNNYVVNRSVDARMVERASGRPVATVRAADVIKDPSLVTRVDEGRQAQQQAPQPILRGTGQANSAPQPTAAVISTLSDRPVERNGRPARNLFNRQTVTSAPLAPRAPAAGTTPSMQAPAPAAGTKPTPPPPTAPAPNAPVATPPATNNPPAENGGRNRERNRGGRENQGTAPSGNEMAPTQNTPAATPQPTNNPPAENGGRNRDRNRGGQGNAPVGNQMAPTQTAPAAAPQPTNNPPAENGGRNRERNRGGRENQGTAPSGQQNAPATTPPTGANPPPANTSQPDNGTDNRHKKKNKNEDKNNPDNQGGQNAPN